MTGIPVAEVLPATEPGELPALLPAGVGAALASADFLLLFRYGLAGRFCGGTGLPRRERQPLAHAHVNPDRLLTGRQRRFLHRLDPINRPASRTADEAEGLQLLAVWEGPPRTNLDNGTAFQFKPVVRAPALHHAGAGVGHSHTRKLLPRLEPGEAGRLPGRPAAEKGVHGAGELPEDAPACLHGLFPPALWVLCPYLREGFHLVVETARDAGLAGRADPFLQGGIGERTEGAAQRIEAVVPRPCTISPLLNSWVKQKNRTDDSTFSVKIVLYIMPHIIYDHRDYLISARGYFKNCHSNEPRSYHPNRTTVSGLWATTETICQWSSVLRRV